MRKRLLFVTLVTAVIALLYYSLSDNTTREPMSFEEPEPQLKEYFFGHDKMQVNILHDTIKSGQVIGDILVEHISHENMTVLLENSKEQFDARRIKVGRPYHIITNKDSLASPVALIYENDPIHYTVLHLSDSLYASSGEKPVETREVTATGIIESSLYETLMQEGLSQALALEMADIFAWTIDFYRLQKGDGFTVLYEQRFIEDEFIGIGEVKACVFTHHGRELQAYIFEQNGKRDYFDEQGEGLRKAFLKSPLKFGRLTSGYSNRRFHPVQRRFKAHRGTDYAAPTGTPILATGDGKVIASAYKRNNGNYVKIRHNSTFTTQYLHMSKRSVNVGEQVIQGQVIGKVGSTGLATGPHVCYRFWKNGKEVDHRKEDFPSTDPVLAENKERFLTNINELRQRLEHEKPLAQL